MTIVHTLASGSSGNALLVHCGDTKLLLDAGISCRRIAVSLRELGLELSDLDAIVVTHTHSDHISGMKTLMSRTDLPIYASERTCRELDYRLPGIEHRLCPCAYGMQAAIGVTPHSPMPPAPPATGSTLATVPWEF